MTAPDWRELAACRGEDTELFFPEGSAAQAPQACTGCPVRADCLAYADEHRIAWGTWGGETEGDRQLRWRRARRRASAARRREATAA